MSAPPARSLAIAAAQLAACSMRTGGELSVAGAQGGLGVVVLGAGVQDLEQFPMR